ncbi:MAG: hypothetical protein IJM17_07700 [Firmicutes bacterium]|nr:hypothetical protein [Bacillota bacterium]
MSLYDNSNDGARGLSSLALRICAMALTVMYTLHHYLAQSLSLRGWMELLCWPAMLLFCFLLGEGVLRTQDKWLYYVRLLIFAALAELPYNKLSFGYYISTEAQNVLFTVLLCACLLFVIDRVRIGSDNMAATIAAELICAAAGIRLSELLSLEMGRFAVIASILCYISVRVTYSGIFRLISIGLLCLSYGGEQYFSLIVSGKTFTLPVQAAALPALLLIHFYKGKRGPNGLLVRYLSYFFYPLLIGLTLYLKMKGIKL